VGNYPLRLLDRNLENYRQTISARKPWEDEILHRDPTYVMIFFFDIMIRSAMRDGLLSHMWLPYFDILVDRILRSMDRDHPDYDADAEFPNFGYYLIYEIFNAYGQWLHAIECCQENSPAIKLKDTSSREDGSGVVKWTMVSMSRSLRYLIKDDGTEERFKAYIMEMVVRDYDNLAGVQNGPRYQEALLNHLIRRDDFRPDAEYGARLRDCYDQIDHPLKFDTREFEEALRVAFPRWGEPGFK
jgi:hypothetical protein